MRLTSRADPSLDQEMLRSFIDTTFSADVTSVQKKAEGAFGIIYSVQMTCDPGQVVIKAHKFPGRGLAEKRQLEALRKYAPVPVPQVYALHIAPDTSYEVLIMEHLPGIEGRQLGELDEKAREKVARHMIEVQRTLHAVRSPNGFGRFDGPYYETWWGYYGQRVRAINQLIQHPFSPAEELPSLVREVAQHALDRVEDILSHRQGEAVLIHSDYCLGNLLFHPSTYQVTGLIDPLDAEWADYELDLVHLTKSHGNRYHLLETYQRMISLDQDFELRYWFYMFWTWLYYYALIGLYDAQWYPICATQLKKVMLEKGLM